MAPNLRAEPRVLEFNRRVEAPARRLERAEWSGALAAELAIDLPGTVNAGSLARHAIAEVTAGAMVRREQDMLKLLVSELVNNAVEHGGADHRSPVVLHLGVTFARARAEVCDCGVGFDAERLPERGSEEPGGKGLLLLDCFASRWGSLTEEGTCVWFELDR